MYKYNDKFFLFIIIVTLSDDNDEYNILLI